jgi:hypothetical protein
MNDKSKLLETFRTNLRAAAKPIGVRVAPMPREGAGAFRVTAMDDDNLDLNLYFTVRWDDAGLVRFDDESFQLKNLAVANLRKHILKRLAVKRANRAEAALEDAKDTAGHRAEESMARFITTELHGFKHNTRDDSDLDYHVWRNDRGFFKLAYVHVTGTVNAFEFEYNIEFDFAVNPRTGDLKIKGEFDAKTSAEILRTMSAILSMN